MAAINTITSVMGVNLDTLRPEPCVEGYTTPGGYSSKAVKPIALAKVGALASGGLCGGEGCSGLSMASLEGGSGISLAAALGREWGREGGREAFCGRCIRPC